MMSDPLASNNEAVCPPHCDGCGFALQAKPPSPRGRGMPLHPGMES
jgi:hypothetical protein